MAFSLEKVVKYQEIEDSSKYFKIVRGNEINISERDMSNVSVINLKDNEINLYLGFDTLSIASIEEAKGYFKNYGFVLKVVDYKVDSKKKLTNIELSLLEDEKRRKQENIKKSYGINVDGGLFDLEESKALLKKDKRLCLLIHANKKNGEHSITYAHIYPPAPPRPPLAPPAPKASPILPAPPKPPLAPKSLLVPPKPPVKVGFRNKMSKDSIKLIGEGQLGKNPLVFINGKQYSSDVLYKINTDRISNTTTYQKEAVMKKFGVDNADGAIEINTFNRSDENLFLSKKQSVIAFENEKKRSQARLSGKSLTRVTLKDFNGKEKDELVVYKNGQHRASVTVSKGGEVLFMVGNVIKSEEEMKYIEPQLLGSTCFASQDKKEINKLGIKVDNNQIEAVMKFNY